MLGGGVEGGLAVGVQSGGADDRRHARVGGGRDDFRRGVGGGEVDEDVRPLLVKEGLELAGAVDPRAGDPGLVGVARDAEGDGEVLALGGQLDHRASGPARRAGDRDVHAAAVSRP